MTESQIQALADGVASMLLSNAAHGMATSSLEGMGEITLRDGLVVAAAAAAARARRAWVIEREVRPNGWAEGEVDLMVSRVGNANATRVVGSVELKWWRKIDPSNAANRRRDLFRDFIRAASVYPLVESFSFVALLSTLVSWKATAATKGSDSEAMQKVSASGSQSWNTATLSTSAGVRGALRSLNGVVPVCSTFHSELLCSRSLASPSGDLAFAKVWRVKKPQKSVFLTSARIQALAPAPTKKMVPAP
jgi:hypothetical protein